jgi:hypothetical protein
MRLLCLLNLLINYLLPVRPLNELTFFHPKSNRHRIPVDSASPCSRSLPGQVRPHPFLLLESHDLFRFESALLSLIAVYFAPHFSLFLSHHSSLPSLLGRTNLSTCSVNKLSFEFVRSNLDPPFAIFHLLLLPSNPLSYSKPFRLARPARFSSSARFFVITF